MSLPARSAVAADQWHPFDTRSETARRPSSAVFGHRLQTLHTMVSSAGSARHWAEHYRLTCRVEQECDLFGPYTAYHHTLYFSPELHAVVDRLRRGRVRVVGF